MSKTELSALHSSTLSTALKSLAPVDLSWRPMPALKQPELLTRLSSVASESGAGYDICPLAPTFKGADIPISPSSFPRSVPRIKKVRHGMVLLRKFLPEPVQARLLSVVRQHGVETGGFYSPRYEDGSKIHCKMMCMGQHWNPQKGLYEATRSNHDNATPPRIPGEFMYAVQQAIKLASEADAKTMGLGTIPFNPDIALCNWYTAGGKMGLHQDKHESPEALRVCFFDYHIWFVCPVLCCLVRVHS